MHLRWHAWYGDDLLEIAFPPHWQVTECAFAPIPALPAGALNAALQEPLAGPSLREQARGAASAAVVVEDHSRPLPAAQVLPVLLAELAAAGLGPDRVRVLIGLGGHPPMAGAMLAAKLGPAVRDCYTVLQHSPYENLRFLGTTRRGTPVHLDRAFLEADLRIGLGTVMPHSYVGFAGGPKVVAVGLAGIETIAAHHGRTEAEGVPGAGRPGANDSLEDLQEIAGLAGLGFLVNGTVNERRELAALFAGDPAAVHRAGVSWAMAHYATRLPDAAADVVVANAYPKDTDLMQVYAALNVLAGGLDGVLKPQGTLVLVAACPEGLGWHALGGPGMRHPWIYRRDADFAGRELILLSPGLSLPEARQVYPDVLMLASCWDDVRAELARRHGPHGRAAVFPCGALQIGRAA